MDAAEESDRRQLGIGVAHGQLVYREALVSRADFTCNPCFHMAPSKLQQSFQFHHFGQRGHGGVRFCISGSQYTKEPLIRSIMNRVADKNGMIARRATQVAAATRYCVAADCGSSRLLPFPHRRCAHRVMAAVILRCQGAQHRERLFLSQPLRALALRAVCGVRLRHVTGEASRLRERPLATIPAPTASRTVSWSLPFASALSSILSRSRERRRSSFPPLAGES